MKEKLYISWEEIFHRLQKFDKVLNVVYGVPKGGMILCAFLKNARITHDPTQATVILDDIIDSEHTRDHYKKLYPEIRFEALFNPKEEGILFNKKQTWLVFPWENDHPCGEESVEENIVRIFQYIGENAERQGLLGTPKRVVKMWKEVFRGYNEKLKPKITLFDNGLDGILYDQMITDNGEFYSYCEHHMVPFFGQYWFAYIPHPRGKVIGLSKVARIVDFHCAKLQIQERLVHDIVEDLWNGLSKGDVEPLGMALVMEAEHLCKTMRGVKKKGKMKTTKLKGVFRDLPEVRMEFLNAIK